MTGRRIIYNVTVKIESEIEAEWLDWMTKHHIPDVLATNLFEKVLINRLLHDDGDGGVTFAFQYICKSLEAFNIYQKKHAAALQNDHSERYKDRYVAFRTLMEIVDEIVPKVTN